MNSSESKTMMYLLKLLLLFTLKKKNLSLMMMETSTKETGKTKRAKNTDMESKSLEMETFLKATGKKESWTEKGR